jgi:hypothetical protein
MKTLSSLAALFLIFCAFYGMAPGALLGFKMFGMMGEASPWISREFPLVTYLFLGCIAMFVLLNPVGAFSPKDKKVFYVWDAEEGILGPVAFGELNGLPLETLIYSVHDGALENWRPLRAWHSNGTKRMSLKGRMAVIMIITMLAALHTWNLMPMPSVGIIAGSSTIVCFVTALFLPDSGSIKQKPAGFWKMLFGGPQPPDLS